MGKSYLQSAEASSAFLNPVPLESDEYRKGERQDTAPFREARFINIERIKEQVLENRGILPHDNQHDLKG